MWWRTEPGPLEISSNAPERASSVRYAEDAVAVTGNDMVRQGIGPRSGGHGRDEILFSDLRYQTPSSNYCLRAYLRIKTRLSSVERLYVWGSGSVFSFRRGNRHL